MQVYQSLIMRNRPPLAPAKWTGSPKPLGRKNSFPEQTSAKFVRPVPRTVGFAARGAAAW